MNESDVCDSLINKVNWTDAISLLVLGILLIINVMVVVGNCLVIAAVYMSSKLRTVTNLFIVSLAVADLMVGVAVLPFSATWEVFKVWIFGDLWCSIWLAVDVWMCTASILNLCAISLDRYVAVTRPVNYPSIMSSSRAKILIAGVWILSFVICFPPLVGWKDSRPANESMDSLASFRIRHPHPMMVNHRPSVTSLLDLPPTTPTPITTTTTTTTEMITTTGTVTEFPSNLTDILNRNVSDEYGSGENEVKNGYQDYSEEYDEYSWTKFGQKLAERVRRTIGDDIFKRIASFSGVPIVSINQFQHPSQSDQEKPFMEASSEPTPVTTSQPLSDHVQCPWICELTSDTGYVIYSALGSFFIPMGVMLFFYWRIYRAAVQTTRAINQGFRTTKGSGGFSNRFDEQRLTLRIHRGRGSVQNHSTPSGSVTSTNCGSVSNSPSANIGYGKSPEVQRLARDRSMRNPKTHEKIKISVSYPSSEQISTSVLNNNGIPPPTSAGGSPRSPNDPLLDASTDNKNYLSIEALRSPKKNDFISSPAKKPFFQNHFASRKFSAPKEVAYAVHYSNKNGKETTTTNVYKTRESNCFLKVTNSKTSSSPGSKSDRSLSIDSTISGYDEDSMSRRNSTRSQCINETTKELSPSSTFDDANPQKPKLIPKMGKRNIKTQVKRFRMETKAAKTLGIIVGGFILCWMPFFTIYLIRAFCPHCINHIVFSVLFWLGYCNSAINPCIYALFSKDFRFAFKKIICRFFCGPEKKLSVNLKRKGSDGSQMKSRGRQRSPSYNPRNSVGEDSDQGGSESR